MLVQRFRFSLVAGHPVTPGALVSLRPLPQMLMTITPIDRTEARQS
jgi:hypothetical protein